MKSLIPRIFGAVSWDHLLMNCYILVASFSTLGALTIPALFPESSTLFKFLVVVTPFILIGGGIARFRHAERRLRHRHHHETFVGALASPRRRLEVTFKLWSKKRLILRLRRAVARKQDEVLEEKEAQEFRLQQHQIEVARQSLLQHALVLNPFVPFWMGPVPVFHFPN